MRQIRMAAQMPRCRSVDEVTGNAGRFAAGWPAPGLPNFARAGVQRGSAQVHARAVVDLKSVNLHRRDGEEVLAEMHAAGVEFLASGIQNKHLLAELAKGQGERNEKGTHYPDRCNRCGPAGGGPQTRH
jgi:hypothetical protein